MTVASLLGRVAVLATLLSLLAPLEGWAQSDYRIGAGDNLKIVVFQSNDLATETRVSESGTISFPLVGELQVAGLTTSDLERMIAKRLREGSFLVNPSVNVNVSQFRSLQVSVLGYVNKPGKIALEQSINRVSELIAMAGGVTPQGGDMVTLFTRAGDGEKRIDIDLPNVFTVTGARNDAIVRNGDTIFVPRAPVFYIYGEVQHPGQYRLERDMTVMQALAAGGGLTQRGTERGTRINRRNSSGKLELRAMNLDDRVDADDVIYVRESLF
jgi:polysaccharide export outer membrane protein